MTDKESYDDELEKLKEEYNKTIDTKIKLLKSLIDNLLKTPKESELQELKNEVHKIVGSAGAYGHTEVAKLCQNMEKQLNEWLKEIKTNALEEKHFTILKTFIETIEKTFIPNQEKTDTPPPSKETSSTLKKEIFALDDDDDILKIIKVAFEKQGYTVITATTMKETIDLFKKREAKKLPDLAIFDRLIPDGDGLEVYKHLKKTYPDFPPSLILSKLSAEKDVMEGLQIGAIDYVTKPFSIEILIEKAKKLLKEA